MDRLGGPGARRNAATTGKARFHSCSGPYAAAWLTVFPTSPMLRFSNEELQCAMRRRLGLAICYEGPDTHGHHRINDNRGGRWEARHKALVKAWRQVFTEAGSFIPDRNAERQLRNIHMPVPSDNNRRIDIVAPCLNVARGLPLFCDATIISPISRNGRPRGGTSNRGGRLLDEAERANNNTYWEVENSGLGALYCLGVETYGRIPS